jgi:hypothetical protein
MTKTFPQAQEETAPAPPALSATAMRQALEAERQQRAQACAAEIDAAVQPLLVRHRCQMLAVPSLAPDGAGGWRVVAAIQIVAGD